MLPALVLAMVMQAGGGVTTIARDSMSHADSARQVAARTEGEWTALWRLHAGEAKAPAVDLESRTVVAVFLGSRPSAGYAVEITGTRRQGKVLIVEWRETRPEPGDITAQVLTAPAHIASIPRFVGEIKFEKAER